MPFLSKPVSLLLAGMKQALEATGTAIGVITAPWRVTSEPIGEFLSARGHPSTEDPALSWADKKLAEHSFVGITCGLLAGVVSAAFSWQSLDSLPWATKGLWYGSLMMDLASICLATQQSLALNRLCCYQQAAPRIRNMLGDVQGRPRRSQLFVWQAPIMLLNVGVALFIIGLINLIFSNFETPRSRYDDRTLVLVTLAGAFAGLTYLSSYLLLYSQTVPEK